MEKKLFNRLFLVFSILLLLFSFVFSLCFGAEKISWGVFFGQGDKFDRIILLNLRLPRALLVLLTGILLGGSGAVFQLFFRNPLAEPGIMGISSGATLGAVIASSFLPVLHTSLQSVTSVPSATLVPSATSFHASLPSAARLHTLSSSFYTSLPSAASGLPPSSATSFFTSFPTFISPVNLFAFLGALLAGLFVTSLAFTKSGKNSSVMLLLCGTALGTLYSSISSIFLLSINKELHSIYTWILGSFNGRGWKELMFILPVSVVSIILMLVISRPLDMLSCGEKTAESLGVQVDKLRILVLISGSLAVSAAVCAGGTIGFVGLIAPHIIRKIYGPKSSSLIPYSMIFGAVLLLFSDTIARVVIAPSELPAGVITSILGVPFFLALCLKKS